MPDNGHRSGLISLLTDFGQRDSYVGQVKGIILGVFPAARLVDLTHDVPPQDVLEGAFQLATSWNSFPAGTVHLAVVDPGVGTARRPVAVSWKGHLFVLPDNGLMSLVLGPESPEQLVVLDRPAYHRANVSSTFHGRDLFGVVAAHLASGRSIDVVGSLSDPESIVRLPLPQIQRVPSSLTVPIVSVDHFGNCRMLLTRDDLPWPLDRIEVRCGALAISGIVTAYGDVAPGEALALFGSHGGLEVSVNGGNAARSWGIERGTLVEVGPGT